MDLTPTTTAQVVRQLKPRSKTQPVVKPKGKPVFREGRGFIPAGDEGIMPHGKKPSAVVRLLLFGE